MTHFTTCATCPVNQGKIIMVKKSEKCYLSKLSDIKLPTTETNTQLGCNSKILDLSTYSGLHVQLIICICTNIIAHTDTLYSYNKHTQKAFYSLVETRY